MNNMGNDYEWKWLIERAQTRIHIYFPLNAYVIRARRRELFTHMTVSSQSEWEGDWKEKEKKGDNKNSFLVNNVWYFSLFTSYCQQSKAIDSCAQLL